jgi:arabinofuranosyltransferase
VWEAFSFFYYGALVPNTALAKLETGIPTEALLAQGFQYWDATFAFDPVTVIVLGLGLLLFLFYGWPGRLIAIGASVHLGYVTTIGGDFMTGRFFTPDLLWVVVGLAGLPSAWPRRLDWGLALTAPLMVASALIGSASPWLLRGSDFGAADGGAEAIDWHGVVDERRFYYPTLGLLPRLGQGVRRSESPLQAAGVAARRRTAARQVIPVSVAGVFSFYAGPRVHVIDRYALSDPLLARLPARSPWRIGHFERDIPDGYAASLETDRNLIRDPQIHARYDDIRLVTRGPLWSVERLTTAARLAWNGP